MRRFYVVLGLLAAGLGLALFVLLRQGGGGTAAAAGPPPTVVDDGFRGYTLGSGDAVVEITEFSDFECPFCATFATIQMPTIKQQLISTGKVRWRYRDFPLPSHQYSRYSAHAAHCAGEQGKFWEMHDQLFYNHQWAQTGRNPAGLFRDFARNVGLDLQRYDECMTAGRYASRIEFSRQEGTQLLVNGTPTFFVNGKMFSASRATSDAFKAMADSIIARTPARPRAPADR
ncbi:MAG TPA: thioredoxin domain-containing protein [Gemmatimonadales bacterium]|nr:thioredoxin domain-containing protein [Gemmatimonadales bacterium]